MMTNPHGLLAGKIAIITGGASGIGRSTVIRFVQEGAKVTIVDLDEVEGRKLETELNAEHQKQVSIFVKADVSSSADAQKIVEETVSAFGTVDVLFNNAGIQAWIWLGFVFLMFSRRKATSLFICLTKACGMQ